MGTTRRACSAPRMRRCIGPSRRGATHTKSSATTDARGAGPGKLAIAELAQRGLVVRPAALHLHVRLQEHLRAEERLHGVAGLGADALQGGALLADDDRLVAGAVDVDRGGDAPQVP